jgi:hypothetical protein
MASLNFTTPSVVIDASAWLLDALISSTPPPASNCICAFVVENVFVVFTTAVSFFIIITESVFFKLLLSVIIGVVSYMV